jgi:hypothetical protein
MHVSPLGILHNNEEVEVALCEWLQKHDCNFFCEGIFKLACPRDHTIWASFIMFYLKKNMQLNTEKYIIKPESESET